MELEDCPRNKGLKILARKWSHYILRALETPKTFSEIQQEFTLITNHILSQELHKLTEEKLVEHKEEKYRTTQAGKELVLATEAVHQWAVKHHDIVACPEDLACKDCARYQEYIEKSRTQ